MQGFKLGNHRCSRVFLVLMPAIIFMMAFFIDDQTAFSAPGGSISGTVTDTSGNPLQNIAVNIYGSDSYTVLTDVNGNYSETGLPEGSYKVSFWDYSGTYASQYYNNKPDLASADIVTVTAGSNTSGIDATMLTNGSISGTVTDASGTPLQDIAVSVRSADYFGVTQTDADGNYNTGSLPSGSYTIYFHDYSGKYASQYYNNKPDLASADIVTVAAENYVTGINASMLTTTSISGTVTDASGNPLQGISVTAQTGPTGFGDTTDANGNYTIGSLSPGNYTVRFYDFTRTYVTQYFDNKPNNLSANIVTVTEGNNTPGINAAMQLGGFISGTITDVSGAPLQNIYVNIHDATSGSMLGQSKTDTSGNYSVGPLSPGNYKVRFWDLSNYYSAQYYNNKPDLSSADTIIVTAGGYTTGINATLGLRACVDLKPVLQLDHGSVYWASLADYEYGLLSVDYTVWNAGSVDAFNFTITGASNTKGVTLATPVPDVVSSSIASGGNTGFTLAYNVPVGTASFTNMVRAVAVNACGHGFTYP